jgi:hypothetical protein
MSYYFNKITDLIKNKVYVDKGPLEIPCDSPKKDSSNVININSIQKIPLLKDLDSNQETFSNISRGIKQPDKNNEKKLEVDFNVRSI